MHATGEHFNPEAAVGAGNILLVKAIWHASGGRNVRINMHNSQNVKIKVALFVAQNLWISLAYRLSVFAFYIFLPFCNLSHIPAATNPRSSLLEILVDSLSRWLKRIEDSSWFGISLDSASNATFQLDPACHALSIEQSTFWGVTYKHDERLYIKSHEGRNVSTPDWPHWSSQQLYLLQFTNCENGRNLWHCDRAFLGAQVRDEGSWGTIYGSHALSHSRFSQKSMIRLENLEVHQNFAQDLSLHSCFVRFV